jgi:hypothetical protein
MSTFNHKTLDGDLEGTIEFEDGLRGYSVAQNIKPFLQEAADEKAMGFNKKTHYRKFASIPDVVAIEILDNHGINIHDPEVTRDKWEMKKFKDIVIREYPYLIVST